VLREMRQHFRPEFLNRVDDIVLFKPLKLEEIEQIVDLMTAELRRRLTDRDIGLELTPRARELVAKRATTRCMAHDPCGATCSRRSKRASPGRSWPAKRCRVRRSSSMRATMSSSSRSRIPNPSRLATEHFVIVQRAPGQAGLRSSAHAIKLRTGA
jgi:hypothetical protein